MQLRKPPLDLQRVLCSVLVAGALAVWPALARADSVLLIAPRRADPVLADVFHRLEAELKIHGYDTATASADAESKPEASAQAAGAVAAIAVVKRGAAVALQVWLIDRAGGSASPRRIEAGGARDAASLLAVRAVDLLRATFGEPAPVAANGGGRTPQRGPSPAQPAPNAAADGGGPTNQHSASPMPPPANAAAANPAEPGPEKRALATPTPASPAAPTPAPATPTPASPALPTPSATSPAAAPAPPPSAAASPDTEPFVPEPPNQPEPALSRIWLSAEGALLYSGARFGTAIGPALGLDMWLQPWLSLGVHGAAPLLGAELSTGSGSANITEELAWLELRARTLTFGVLDVYPLLGGGMAWLQGQGHANQPLTSIHGHNWSWMAQLGVRVELALSPRLHAGAALRLAAFAPSLEVAVGHDSARLSLPTLSASLGLAFGL